MSRIVSVWLPHLSIERLKRERSALTRPSVPDERVPDDRPFALVGSDAHGLVLTAVNGASARQGLLPGLGLADARAICPHLLTSSAAPEKDADALLALARWSNRYSPTLNVDGEDGLWLDVTGVSHLFGDETNLLSDLAGRLERAGLTTRLGLAETLGGAHALARFAHPSPRLVPDGKMAAALASLPVEALRLDPEIATLLRRLGLKRIGQLYDLPRASLERRFHSAEAVLLRLDQALGRSEEPRAPLLPASDFTARLPLAEPLITHEGVVAGLDRLAEDMCRSLTRAGRGARRVALWIAHADGSSAAIEAGLSVPSRAPEHVMRLLKNKLEAVDMGFGVDLMMLAALVTEKLHPAQTSLAEKTERPSPEILIDTLTNRLGPNAVRRLFPKASHIPELTQKTRSAFAGVPCWTEPASGKSPRPALLLAKPEDLTVLSEVPEGPPMRFTWRLLTRRVVKAEGPERIAPEWWRSLTPLSTVRPRDYYRIEDEDGCRYWVFREGLYQDNGEPPCWYLHGVFA